MEAVIYCSNEVVVDLSDSGVKKVKFINTGRSILKELWLEGNKLTSLRLPVRVDLINLENNPNLETVEFHNPGRCSRVYLEGTRVSKIKGMGDCSVMSYNPLYKLNLE